MAMKQSYGMQVLGVLTVVTLGLLAVWGVGHLSFAADLSQEKHAEPALLALGLALVVGLRGVERLEHGERRAM